MTVSTCNNNNKYKTKQSNLDYVIFYKQNKLTTYKIVTKFPQIFLFPQIYTKTTKKVMFRKNASVFYSIDRSNLP